MRASAYSASSKQLPRGRHRLSPQEVESNQRDRMLAAMVEALEEHGYARATVAHVLEGAGVSRRTFYELFDNKDDCLLAAYQEAEERAWAEAAAAAGAVPAGDWPGRVRAALGAVLELFAAEPAMARLFTVEARAAMPEIAARHRDAIERAAKALRAGNQAYRPSIALPAGTERTLVGNVAALAGAYVLSGAAEQLTALAPQFGDHLLQPLAGPPEAKETSAAARRSE